MAEGYSWVSEGSARKYHRAIEQLRKEGKSVTEEAIKELYVKWGGLVMDDSAPMVEEEVQEAPKRGRKAKVEE